MKLLNHVKNGLRFLALVGAGLVMAGFASTNARASLWTFQDGFDVIIPGQTNYTWWTVGRAGGGVQVPRLPARSSSRTMYMFADTGGWSSVYENIKLTPFFVGRTLNTVAAIYARPISGVNARVSVEVIDPDTWTYIALKTVTLTTSATWQLVVTDPFIPYRKDIVVRISVGSDAGVVQVDLDDLTVQAQYF